MESTLKTGDMCVPRSGHSGGCGTYSSNYLGHPIKLTGIPTNLDASCQYNIYDKEGNTKISSCNCFAISDLELSSDYKTKQVVDKIMQSGTKNNEIVAYVPKPLDLVEGRWYELVENNATGCVKVQITRIRQFPEGIILTYRYRSKNSRKFFSSYSWVYKTQPLSDTLKSQFAEFCSVKKVTISAPVNYTP